MPEEVFDVVVIGAGPAGIAAACAAAECGARTALLDDNPAPGGQIWRLSRHAGRAPDARRWLEKLERSGARWFARTSAVDAPEPGLLAATEGDSLRFFRYSKLILATGARERFLPFPGWTLPGVVGAGGLETLVRKGLPVAGARVVVAGSGPLLLAVADELRAAGAEIRLVAEQAAWKALARFVPALMARPSKCLQAAVLRWRLKSVTYSLESWPLAAEGSERLEAVRMRLPSGVQRIPCDYLACGFGLVPSLELAALLGCRIRGGFVETGELQETSVPGVYCAGEPTGIGGIDQAIPAGLTAGYAAAGRSELARRHVAARDRAVRFRLAMERSFALRDELKQLCEPQTLVCRCEDVAHAMLAGYENWRAAKLHTRCGMGSCQGRICGPAVQFLFGWNPVAPRPPLFPVRVSQLSGEDAG